MSRKPKPQELVLVLRPGLGNHVVDEAQLREKVRGYWKSGWGPVAIAEVMRIDLDWTREILGRYFSSPDVSRREAQELARRFR